MKIDGRSDAYVIGKVINKQKKDHSEVNPRQKVFLYVVIMDKLRGLDVHLGKITFITPDFKIKDDFLLICDGEWKKMIDILKGPLTHWKLKPAFKLGIESVSRSKEIKSACIGIPLLKDPFQYRRVISKDDSQPVDFLGMRMQMGR